MSLRKASWISRESSAVEALGFLETLGSFFFFIKQILFRNSYDQNTNVVIFENHNPNRNSNK